METDLSKIAVTLKYGAFNGENPKKIWIAYSIFVIPMLAGIVLGVVLLSIEHINHPDSTATFVAALLSVVLGCSLLPVIVFLLLYRNEKIRKEIRLWSEDAVALDAYIKTIDRRRGFFANLIKFEVIFDWEGNHYTRSSEEEKQIPTSFESTKGYFPDMAKYVDRKVKILYSPKYNQVMILKDATKTT